MAALTQNV